jgi:hypothetical protein
LEALIIPVLQVLSNKINLFTRILGHYCESGTKEETPCPVGTYRSSTGGSDSSTGATGCTECTEEYICASLGLTSAGSNCPAGFYCPEGTALQHALPCEPGYRCPLGVTGMEVCPDKYYQNLPTQDHCEACPERFTCENGGVAADAEEPVICPQGYYCPALNSSPIVCPEGTFSLRYGLKEEAECEDCSPGKYCTGTAQTAVTGDCTQGYFCTRKATTATPTNPSTEGGDICPAGFYCETGAIAPTPCPPGTYTLSSETGRYDESTHCSACPQGYYCPFRGATDIDLGIGVDNSYKCLAGYVCVLGSALPNPIGDYPAVGYPCPVGTYCVEGAVSEEDCDAGMYNPYTAQGECLDCPAGKKCPSTAMDAYESCDEGQSYTLSPFYLFIRILLLWQYCYPCGL